MCYEISSAILKSGSVLSEIIDGKNSLKKSSDNAVSSMPADGLAVLGASQAPDHNRNYRYLATGLQKSISIHLWSQRKFILMILILKYIQKLHIEMTTNFPMLWLFIFTPVHQLYFHQPVVRRLVARRFRPCSTSRTGAWHPGCPLFPPRSSRSLPWGRC